MAGSWMVRVADADEVALRHGVIVANWPELGDISQCQGPEDVRERLSAAYEEKPRRTLGNYAGQLWRFLGEMCPGDYVAMPFVGSSRHLAIGRIVGRYRFRADASQGLRHTRAVEWLRKDVSLNLLRDDLRNSLGSIMRISRLLADPDGRRLAALARGEPDPGPTSGVEVIPVRYRASVVDVGDGACTIIRTPHDGRDTVTVVDCGSNSISADEACDRLLDALDGRPERIDTIVVTHFDADHYLGFVRLAERMSVRGQRFDALRLISPRPPESEPRFAAAYLAMALTVTGVRSLDLAVGLEQVTRGGQFRYAPLCRGSSFLAGGRGYEVLWPLAVLPKTVTRQVRRAVHGFEELAEALADRGNTVLRDNFEAARQGGWLHGPDDETQRWTMRGDPFVDGEPISEDLDDSDEGSGLHIDRLNLPDDLRHAFREVWDEMRRANNNMSLVFEDAEPGRLVVFGDAGPPVLSWLAKTDLNPAHYALMLAPHHGTQYLPPPLRVTADLCVAQNGSKRGHLWERHRGTHDNHGRCVSSTSGTHHLLL
ncbi:MBL fold metallo-hydrolase [Micromonospora okii]|uniref:MBL fold metallo-hydrolase n=1 Tax=Micromonospora okii TaxID=1182970 RepID=UPI001E48D3B1|nr:MBL fold metallo-hydrolase [Micromonospora okii]